MVMLPQRQCTAWLPVRINYSLVSFLVNPTHLLRTTHGLSVRVKINEQVLPLSSISPEGQLLSGAYPYWPKAAGNNRELCPAQYMQVHGAGLTANGACQSIDRLTPTERGVLRAEHQRKSKGHDWLGWNLWNQHRVIWSSCDWCEPHQYCRWLTSFTWIGLR